MAHYWMVGLGTGPAVVCCQLIDLADIEADDAVPAEGVCVSSALGASDYLVIVVLRVLDHPPSPLPL